MCELSQYNDEVSRNENSGDTPISNDQTYKQRSYSSEQKSEASSLHYTTLKVG